MQALSKGKQKAKSLNVAVPDQALRSLANHQLSALISQGSLWLAASAPVLRLLHDCALGNNEGGPHTAQDTAKIIVHNLQIAPEEVPSELVSVRLSPEEGFFLKFAVGNLTVVSTAGPISVQELWLDCVKHTPGFAHRYVAYHHFRSKGWIPRSGVQYGADLVLYEQHPAVVHSTICVLVVPVTQNNDQLDKSSCNAASIPDGHDGHLAWHGLEGLNRLCTRVGKRLMLLYVQQPQHANLDSPLCLNDFQVAEHNVERWVPEATINML